METRGGIRAVPQRRIMEKVDECMNRRDYAGVERVLLYWLEEARSGGDLRGELMVRGELVGHYRKTDEREKAYESAREALRLIRSLDWEGTVSAATAQVNIATAYNSFGDNEEALALFEKARAAYEKAPSTPRELLGGLYNNMGLTCAALGRYADALALYDLALKAMGEAPRGQLEQAVTCLNMANAVEAEQGMDEGEGRIFELLERAEVLLDAPEIPRDGYCAYICEKCAPTFEYYGFFAAAEKYKKRAEDFYEGA